MNEPEPPDHDGAEDAPAAATDSPPDASPTHSQSDAATNVPPGPPPPTANVFTISADTIVVGDAEHTTRRGEQPTLPIAEEAQQAHRLYVQGPAHADATELLSNRLLVLCSAHDDGKRTAALALLLEWVPAGELVAITPDLTLEQIGSSAHLDGRGLLLDGARPDELAATSEYQIDVILDRLRRRDSYLVVTTRRAEPFSGPIRRHSLTWEPPPFRAMLRSTLHVFLGPERGDEVFAAVEDLPFTGCTTRQLLDVRDACLRGRPTDELIATCRVILERKFDTQLDEWLNTDPTRDEVCRHLAVAVMSGTRATDVAMAESELRDLFSLDRAGRPARTAFEQRSRQLGRLHATTTEVPDPDGTSEAIVELDPPSRRGPTLRRLYREYPALHPKLFDWIESLGSQPSRSIRYQAASAATELLPVNAVGVIERLVTSWTRSGSERARDTAAMWVGCTVERGAAHAVAIAHLRKWAQRGTAEERCTAAQAIGEGVAVAYPEFSLRLVRRIVRTEFGGQQRADQTHRDVVRAVIRALASFFEDHTRRDLGRSCLDQLLAWSSVKNSSESARLGSLAVAMWLLRARWQGGPRHRTGLVFEWADVDPAVVDHIAADADKISRLLCRGLVTPGTYSDTALVIEGMLRDVRHGTLSGHLTRLVIVEMRHRFAAFDRPEGVAMLDDLLELLRTTKSLVVDEPSTALPRPALTGGIR